MMTHQINHKTLILHFVVGDTAENGVYAGKDVGRWFV